MPFLQHGYFRRCVDTSIYRSEEGQRRRAPFGCRLWRRRCLWLEDGGLLLGRFRPVLCLFVCPPSFQAAFVWPRLDQGQRRRSVGLFLFGLRGSVRRRLHGERLVSDRTRCLDTPPLFWLIFCVPPPPSC